MTAMTSRVKLNEQQELAANHLDGPCFVSACPGSGKTATIIERTIRMIENGVNPKAILSLTFTNKAADEMKERIAKAVGKDAAENLYMSTFHALAANILRKIGGSIGYGGKMTIYDSDDQESFMAQVSRQLGFELNAPQIKEIVWKLNDLRENLTSEEEFEDEFTESWQGKIAVEYMARMRAKNAIDFTGLLYEMVRLLKEDKTALEKLQKRFTHFQVDESQDCNEVQFEIINLLGGNGNIFMVGDLDQSVYAFRGASPNGVNNFIKKFNAKQIRLPVNYRSTKQIVEVAGNLIAHNPNRPSEWKFETVNGDGQPVRCIIAPTPEIEGQMIAQFISNLIKSGEKPESIAVLYRLNSMSRAIESGMVQSQIPYRVLGGFGFYDRKEVKDGLAMLRFKVNPYDGIALSRFVNKPKKGIGEGTLGKLEAFAESEKIDLIGAMKRANEFINTPSMISAFHEIASAYDQDFEGKNMGEVLSMLLSALRYDEYLKTDKDTADKYEDRKDNQQELINSAALYSEQRSNDIAAYLNNIALTTSSDKKTESGSVSLMTMHASKGLEFDTVFLPCLEEDLMPHKRAVQERENGIEEERRLCFVGITRGRHRVVCSYAQKRMLKYGKGGVQFIHTKPSRFIAESKMEVIKA